MRTFAASAAQFCRCPNGAGGRGVPIQFNARTGPTEGRLGYMNRHGRNVRSQCPGLALWSQTPKHESAPVEDRTEELRSLATQCLALASTAADPQVRASMMLMARRFHELATRPGRRTAVE